MSCLYRELVFLILQFQNEEMFKDTVHRLEQESGFFFNMHHFEELVMSGDWEKVENYLAAFRRKNRSSSSEVSGRDMSSLYRELVFLILQFQNEEMFKDTVHRLEQESGFSFNMHHFEELVMSGDWEKVENYLAAFRRLTIINIR
ncbi:topless-related protein 4 [Artemisia annua]|uniref:Topless-related protein 4 n=1 Tax=Artemisia annua TaxID=35608 RepID=A0A2U1KPH9_ARTAN|nr:topless-related protein 4 [Artemisia annua]